MVLSFLFLLTKLTIVDKLTCINQTRLNWSFFTGFRLQTQITLEMPKIFKRECAFSINCCSLSQKSTIMQTSIKVQLQIRLPGALVDPGVFCPRAASSPEILLPHPPVSSHTQCFPVKRQCSFNYCSLMEIRLGRCGSGSSFSNWQVWQWQDYLQLTRRVANS